MHAPLDPTRSVGFLMRDVSRLMRRNFNRRAESLGLTQTQWQVLAQLSRQEGSNQATLAEALEVQPITLVRLIDRLEAMSLVRRQRDAADRRAFRLHLTPAAQPLVEEMWRLAAETRAEAMRGLGKAELDALVATLMAMKRNLLDVETPAAAAPSGNTKNNKKKHDAPAAR